MLSMSGNPASCTASNIGVRRRVFLDLLSLASLGGSDDALLSPDCMDLLLCLVEGAYDDFELAGLLVEVLELLTELPVVSTELLRNGGNSSLISGSVLNGWSRGFQG
jgi:hypothetical protein